MFRTLPNRRQNAYRWAITGQLGLSAIALAVTIWVMVDFSREQVIVESLIQYLPPNAAKLAEELEGELRWQFRLSLLVVLNLVVTGFSFVVLWRAYLSSQHSLRDTKARADDILGSVDQAIITTDLSGNVTSINNRGIELLAVTPDVVGMPLRELTGLLPLEKLRNTSRLRESGAVSQDFTTSGSGTERTWRATCEALRNYEGIGIGDVVQIRDVTERVLLDDRMHRMERYLDLGSLAGGLHHEIKNPLTALSLHVQLLEEELDSPQVDQTIHEMLQVVKTEVARIGGVLESFRDFVSAEQLNLVAVDMGELLERLIRLIEPQAKSKHIRIQFDSPVPAIPCLEADQVKLEQVFLNLLVNAMESMPNGGDLIIRLLNDDPDSTDFARIQVIDTGIGIPKDLCGRIFDPYFTTKSNGSGMGLSICDKIIRLHNGGLDFRSDADGTIFEISLPIDQGSEETLERI